MAFFPCLQGGGGETIHTDSYTLSTNAQEDLGAVHKIRYVTEKAHDGSLTLASHAQVDLGEHHNYRYVTEMAHTTTLSVTANGSTDMGARHAYRYVSTDVWPRGTGVSYFYRGAVKSVTFTAADRYIYFVHCRFVSSYNNYGWPTAPGLALGGSARAWWDMGSTGQANENGMAYNASRAAIIVGNGNNVSVTWNFTCTYGGGVIDCYQIRSW